MLSRILLSEEIPAMGFKGYFVARFSKPLNDGGISRRGELEHAKSGEGQELSGWVTFPHETQRVDVRIGVSFISIDQAWR